MSSPGGQWRLIRHFLSANNAGMEKWLQKVKPINAEQLEELIKKLNQVVSARLNRLKVNKVNEEKSLVKVAAAAETETKLERAEEKSNQDGLTVGSDAKEISFDGFWQGLKLKKDLHFGKISQTSWKSNKPIVTKSSIHSRTAYVISAIVTAESVECLRNRTQHFIDHLKQYPEARDYAIKEGAVRALLRVQNGLDRDDAAAKEVNGVVKEALALVGWMGFVEGPGPRVLSLDGGGIRGLIAIEVLRHLERLTATPVHRLFDYVVGVSTGAIIAAVIGSGAGNLETASRMYHILSKEMFGNTSVIGGTSRLVWTHSYYDTEAWEKMLRDNLGDCHMTECNRYDTPKMALVSCVVGGGGGGARLSPFVFRSYECGFRVRSVVPGSSRARLWQAVRASAAAPTYFAEFRLEGLLHQDGGIAANNPAALAVHEARRLYGPAEVARGTLVSVGTGRALNRHLDYQRMGRGMAPDAPPTSWKDKFNNILDSATDTEGVHLVLNDLLPSGHYFRFNPPLMEECAMDEIDDKKLNNLIVDTQAYIRRNQHKFEQVAAMLTRRRGLPQRALDFLHHRSHLMGLASNN